MQRDRFGSVTLRYLGRLRHIRSGRAVHGARHSAEDMMSINRQV